MVESCEVALRLEGMFTHLGLQSFAKTSGSNGLQVYVPLGAGPVTFARTRAFARMVAELLARDEPELVAAQPTPAPGPGRVCVDWTGNDEQRTTIAAYSLRSRAVSTPVDWDEVRRTRASGRPEELSFDAGQVLDRVAERGDLFAPLLILRQELPAF